MLTIAICDDVLMDVECLRIALEAQLSGLSQAANIRLYPSGEALLAAVEEDGRAFDLIFLDIYMTGLTGMDTARRLRDMGQKMPLVFLTSSPDFAVEGYEVAAAGYLIKPLDKDLLAALLARLLTPAERPRLAVKCGGGHQYFDYDEIKYIESRNHDLFLYTTGGRSARVTARLDEVERQLGDPRFLRCHQSYLVNMDCVSKVEGDFILRDGTRVPIRVRSRKAMADAYYRYFVERTATSAHRKEDACVPAR